MKKYHVSVAAEAYAAAAFARAGYEVYVQYGANQPGYDLVVAKGPQTISLIAFANDPKTKIVARKTGNI
jgi:hypothetical protein